MSKEYHRSLVWIRRDLRLSDHHALHEACLRSHEVIIAFVFDTNILKKLKSKSDARLIFIQQSLYEIDKKIREKYQSALIYLSGDPSIEIPKLADEMKCDAVFINEDYEPSAQARNLQVQKQLQDLKIHFILNKDQVLYSKNDILKSYGTPYKVFTPYKRAWLNKLNEQILNSNSDGLKNFKPNLTLLIKINILIKSRWVTNQLTKFDLHTLGFLNHSDICVTAGENVGNKHLLDFSKKIKNYGELRDRPDLDATSRISTHLRFGTLSIRSCIRMTLKIKNKGSDFWLNELIWREFYQMILYQFPSVVQNAFIQKYDAIKWPGSKNHFELWCQGQTGFPIVDAAMRQLNQTGWMHNRLRMVVASFLVKDLLIDWRWGEKYFSEKLLDFDLAANNGGWQWCASTGCDAQPYFRIFNPTSQSIKFDPNGDFIRKYVPELRELNSKQIHAPSEYDKKYLPTNFKLGKDYPFPIVNHSDQRLKALELYNVIPPKLS